MGILTKKRDQIITQQLDDSMTEDVFDIIFEDGKEIYRRPVDFQTVFGHETDRIAARSKKFQRIAEGAFVPTIRNKHAAQEAYQTAKQANAQDDTTATRRELSERREAHRLAREAHQEFIEQEK